MKSFILGLIVFFSLNLFGNMAYMGPPDGQVSGQQIMPKVRVMHEVLTADMRNLPGGKIRVFANYILQSEAPQGIMRFVFVASSASQVIPEFILDGKVLQYKPSIAKLPAPSDMESNDKLDSFSQVIGYDIRKGKGYPSQPLQDQLFTFDVMLTPGMHELKIGYECEPTGFEEGDLAHWVFPYFLGNTFTRHLYDSIFVHIMLPEGVSHTSNIQLKKQGNEWISGNIAGFSKSHIYVEIYKDVQKELKRAEQIHLGLNMVFWMLLLALSIWVVRRRLDQGKSFGITLALIIPASALAAFVYYFSLLAYLGHYEEKYGSFLRDSWGKGYLFLYIPVIMIFGSAVWLVVVLAYRYLMYKGKK